MFWLELGACFTIEKMNHFHVNSSPVWTVLDIYADIDTGCLYCT